MESTGLTDGEAAKLAKVLKGGGTVGTDETVIDQVNGR